MPRQKTKTGPRNVRLPEPKYFQEEADLILSVANGSVSEFLRTAAVEKATRAKGRS